MVAPVASGRRRIGLVGIGDGWCWHPARDSRRDRRPEPIPGLVWRRRRGLRRWLLDRNRVLHRARGSIERRYGRGSIRHQPACCRCADRGGGSRLGSTAQSYGLKTSASRRTTHSSRPDGRRWRTDQSPAPTNDHLQRAGTFLPKEDAMSGLRSHGDKPRLPRCVAGINALGLTTADGYRGPTHPWDDVNSLPIDVDDLEGRLGSEPRGQEDGHPNEDERCQSNGDERLLHSGRSWTMASRRARGFRRRSERFPAGTGTHLNASQPFSRTRSMLHSLV